MPLPYEFANVTELDTPQLDDNFNALGALSVIPCTASGTNTITLTPASDTPTISAYTSNAPEFSFEAVSTSTGSLTLQINGIGFKNVYKNNGQTAAGANDFISGSTYKVTYNSALNAGAGGWVILNQGASAASAGSVQGVFRNLKVQASSNTGIAITAGQLAVSDGSASFTTLFNVNVTINTGTVGANGIDTGSISASTWYYSYVIYNPNTLTAAGLLSLSSTTPTLPAGYTQFARVGSNITDGSSHLLRSIQLGRRFQYTVGTNPTALPLILNGSATTSAWTAVSVAGVVSATASEIFVTSIIDSGNTSAALAPNGSYGTTSSTSNLPPLVCVAGTGTNTNVTGSILLETTSIYYYTSSSSYYVFCVGFVDNL